MGVQEKEFLNIFSAIISEDLLWFEHFLGTIRWIEVISRKLESVGIKACRLHLRI